MDRLAPFIAAAPAHGLGNDSIEAGGGGVGVRTGAMQSGVTAVRLRRARLRVLSARISLLLRWSEEP